MMNFSPRALFICHTAFQLWLARHIIQQENIEHYTVAFFMEEGDSMTKNCYYYDALTRKQKDSLFIELPPRSVPMARIKKLRSAVRFLKNVFFHQVYFANYEKWSTLMVISAIQFETLLTFDDGMRNFTVEKLYSNSPGTSVQQFKNSVNNWRKRFYFHFTRIIHGIKRTYLPNTLLKQVKQHYSIDISLPNMMSPTPLKQIQFCFPKIGHHLLAKTVRIFVGQTGEQWCSELQFKRIEEEICNVFNISHYFSHPRSPQAIESLISIQTMLLFEDWLIQEISQYPDTIFEIYTLFSTVAVTLPSSPNIRVIALDVGIYPELYDIFVKKNILIKPYQEQFYQHFLDAGINRGTI